MDKFKQYDLLQNLASPVTAITTQHNGDLNGMIANSAGRASLVPELPRVSFYCFKQHFSHELISNSGRFCLHLLHREQFPLIRRLGFESGQERPKMEESSWQPADSGTPVLDDVYAWFDCRVLNGMDAGPSTFFLGEVEESGIHADIEDKELMDSSYFRKNMPEEWKPLYQKNKQAVQQWAKKNATVDPGWNWEPPETSDRS